MAATVHIAPTRQQRPGLGFEPTWTPDIVDVGRRPVRAPQRPSSAVYWRRRLAVGVLLVVLGAGLWTIATWVTNSSVGVDSVGADRAAPLAEEIYVVQPGDTLWSIAAEIEVGGDVRATVDWLAERNGGSAIEVGQRIVIGR